MINIYNLTRKKLEEYFISINEKKYKATQVFEWLYQKQINSFEQMSNIKKELINEMSKYFSMKKIEIVKVQEDKDVKKYLFKLFDSEYIEAVLMYHDYGISLCISSQVGCNMGCAFCESGRLKKVRNLETFEMVQQIILVSEEIKNRISSIVIMGIGEPFDNYDNLLDFIKIINDDKALAIGARHITVSTCGIVDKIKKFSTEKFQVNLALSLHAPNDELRSKLMKVNKVYNINQVINSIKDYITVSNRRVTIEYVMLEYINDSETLALELANLLKGLNVYVNLIPYNETNNISFKKSSMKRILKFYDVLKKNKINVTIRREFGSNIDAACGQLKSKEVK